MILLIAYDLSNPSRDYDDVMETIQSAGSGKWTHAQDSVWLIDTTESTRDWRTKLRNAGDDDDTFFVTRLKHDCAWRNLSTSSASWIKSSDRTW